VPQIAATKKKAVQHRGVSLGKTLFAFAATIEGLQLQVDFLSDLYRELEEIELDKVTPKQIGGRNKPPL
jgi:hypothetical protein